MSNKQLINGGQASPNNIYFWVNSKTKVDSDHVTQFYKLSNDGYMQQTCRLPVKGQIKIMGTYKTMSHDSSLKFYALAEFDNGTCVNNMLDLHNEELNEWSLFNIEVDIPDDAVLSLLKIRVEFVGSSFGAIANISAITYYSNIGNTISTESFIEKAILYGLDANKPELNAISDT